ncbi:MAG: ABC transporter ATP-binding protein [Bacillota bacterium]
MAAIEVENLRKTFQIPQKEPGLAGALKALVRPRFQEKVAVDQVSFAIEPGEMVGYIGVNGAGKSTTIKMLTGILHPSGGSVRVLGRDPFRDRVANAREIGVVFGQRSQLWWDLALIESLDLIGRIYEVEPGRYRQRLAQFTEMLGLDELLRKPVRTMSLGQKMRAELAATFLHEPKVVYLDEPTIGLDLVVKERIRAFIREINQSQGCTVVLTTHDLGDIEELCRRVILIDAGRVVYDGPLATLRERFGRRRVITLETALPAGPVHLPAGALLTEAEAHRLVISFDRTQLTASQVAAAVMAQVEVRDFQLAEPDLASVVRQLYNGALREEVTGL